MSGVPNAFVTLTKLPISKFTTPAFVVSKSLAFLKSLKVTPIFSISYPRTYALPGVHAIASKSSPAVAPSSVDAPLL